MKIRDRIHNRLQHWRYKYGPKVVDALVAASTWQAMAKLKASGPVSILVDNNVLGHGVTHETGWISTGVSSWGGTRPRNTGYAARIPVYADDNTSEAYSNICMLPGIVHLAREGLMQLKTSGELAAEQLHQPIGRFRGYGYFDHSLFASLRLDSVDGIAFPILTGSQGSASARQQQLDRVESKGDPLYRALKAELGEKNSLDAWHIRTAETHNITYFLTMDFKLIRALKSRANREPVKSLKTKVVTPRMLARIYELMAIPPKLYSYHGASFKVRPDLNWPNGKRNHPRRRASNDAARTDADAWDHE